VTRRLGSLRYETGYDFMKDPKQNEFEKAAAEQGRGGFLGELWGFMKENIIDGVAGFGPAGDAGGDWAGAVHLYVVLS